MKLRVFAVQNQPCCLILKLPAILTMLSHSRNRVASAFYGSAYSEKFRLLYGFATSLNIAVVMEESQAVAKKTIQESFSQSKKIVRE